ncbi:hypothetical protein H4W80_001923 [Nonomuraea angiospora]|uniref:Uncharacterized protein n=1 Tax=Nonomuraea angiospora TaxID=46172 RepID=A0ABR9LTH5_9ACTN|nr:hypothetical protein [Nonomuraea angiospora]MBE1583665.1 hypothetical protein [Nonomuraea angiospora]
MSVAANVEAVSTSSGSAMFGSMCLVAIRARLTPSRPAVDT